MLQTFSYNHQDENFNAIVDTAIELVKQNMEGSHKAENYNEVNKALNESIIKYALEGTRYAEKYAENPLDAVKDPRVKKDRMFKENFNVVIAEIVNATAPLVSAPKYNDILAEFVQVGFGDTARFVQESNGLFKVNEIAEGVNRGVLQPMYNNEYTVNASPVEIATAFNWYQLAAGVFDFGSFGWKAAKSFESYIFLKIVGAMTSMIDKKEMGAGYYAPTLDDGNWNALAQRVSAANNGASCYAIGTISALGKVLPEDGHQSNLIVGLGPKHADEGFLDRYHGIPLVAIPNVLKPQTINSSAELVLNDDYIYFVGAANYRPVKVVYEGDSVVIEEIPTENADRMYGIKIEMRIGVSAIVGAKFGVMEL